jgi:hypothetical protein
VASKSESILPIAGAAVLLWWLLSDDAGAETSPPKRADRLAKGGAGLGAGRLDQVERVRVAGTGDPTATPNEGGGDLIRGGGFGRAALEGLGAEFRGGRFVARDDRRSAIDCRSPSLYHLNGLFLERDGLRPDIALLPPGRPDPPVPARWIGGAAVDGGGLTTEGGRPAWRPVSGSATGWLSPWVEAADVPGVQGGDRRLCAGFASKPLGGGGLMVPWVRVGSPSSAVRTGINTREGDPIDGPGFVSETAWIGSAARNFRGIHTEGGETFVSQLGYVQFDAAGDRTKLRRYIMDAGTGKRYWLDGESYSRTLARVDRNREDVRALLYSHGTERGTGGDTPLGGPVQPGPMPSEYLGNPSQWARRWNYLRMDRSGRPKIFTALGGLHRANRPHTYDRRALNLYMRDITYKRAAYWFRRLMGGWSPNYAPRSLVEVVETAAETRRRNQQSFREIPKGGGR